MTDNKSS